MRVFVVLAFIGILASLASALVYLMRDKGSTNRTVNALTVRVTSERMSVGPEDISSLPASILETSSRSETMASRPLPASSPRMRVQRAEPSRVTVSPRLRPPYAAKVSSGDTAPPAV